MRPEESEFSRTRPATSVARDDAVTVRGRASKGRIIIDHTEVPSALRGRKIGERLVRQAIEDARRDRAAAMLPDPERTFRPGKAGIAPIARRRDRGEHLAGLWIDLSDHRLCDLEQVLAVERRARIGGH